MWTHDKDGVTRVFERCHQGITRGMDGDNLLLNFTPSIPLATPGGIFQKLWWCHLFHVFTYIHPLLIEKDVRVCRNILILLPCVLVCLSTMISAIFGTSFHFPFPYFVFFYNHSFIMESKWTENLNFLLIICPSCFCSGIFLFSFLHFNIQINILFSWFNLSFSAWFLQFSSAWWFWLYSSENRKIKLKSSTGTNVTVFHVY